MMSSSSKIAFSNAVRIDAEATARQTLRYEFGPLSNRRILGRLRADFPDSMEFSDDVLLHEWFAEFDRALARLSPTSVSRLRAS